MRRAPTPTFTATVQQPADVRLMNAVASLVYVLVAAGALLAAGLWLMRSPLFPIRSIQLDGDMLRNSVPTLRANAAPQLAGNFFSVDLQQSRRAFEAVPWVRRAVVRRVWPDRLAVRLEEHRPAALWQGPDEDVEPARLVNQLGEVFEANVGDVQDDSLPTLSGPEGSAAQMLSMVRQLNPLLLSLELDIERLHLSGRGSWRVETESGASIELGRGSAEQLLARTERFVRSFSEATAPWRSPLESADLRHTDGYAVRLRGVSVRPAPGLPARPAAPLAAGTPRTN